MDLTRKIGLGPFAAALLVIGFATGANADKPTLGGKLELEDEGSFFVNAKNVRSQYPGASAATGPPLPAISPSIRCTCISASRLELRACRWCLCTAPITPA